MATSRLISLSFAIFIQLFFLSTAQESYPICYNTGNFTSNSTYKSNLNHVLSSFTSDTQNSSGFYNFSSGQKTDKVHAIGLCRGDLKPESCRSCLSNSTRDIENLCPTQKEAIVWSDKCMLRYSNRSILGKMETRPYLMLYNTKNVSKPSEFNQAVNSMLGNLTSVAASGDHRRKFATGKTTTATSETLYALVQCTPDLSKEDCSDCLTTVTKFLPQCCDGKQGGRVLGPSCHIRYETYLFYDLSEAEAPSPSKAPSPSPSKAPSPPTAPSTTTVSPPPPPPPPPPMNTATTKGKESNVFIAIVTLVSVLSLL